jgi:lipoyl(octanoyl) transferase
VWTPDNRKITSIGMRIRGGVSNHGFALNVAPDMAMFKQFVCCGLSDQLRPSRARRAAGRAPTPSQAEVRNALAQALGAAIH